MINKTNINDVEETFAKLDFALICEEEYKSLKQIDWVVFSILKNQEGLSKNSYHRGNKSYVDSNGNVFIRISQEKLAKLLKLSIPTLRASLKRLEKVFLIENINVGLNKCNKIYVGNPNRSITFSEYVNKIGIELDNEIKEYEPQINVTNINNENKKVVSSPQTNNSKEDLAQSSNYKYTNGSIAQNKEYIQDESNVILKIDQKTHENFRILQSSGIKYIPYEKQEQFILSLDIEILKLAINITIEKAQKPNWNYLISTYEDLKNKNVSSNTEKFSKDVVDFNNKNRFHNFEETFTKYTEEEFEDIILKSQKKKFG